MVRSSRFSAEKRFLYAWAGSERPKTTIVLGAGAGRAVSYAEEMAIDSPLEGDFFDLLGWVKVQTGEALKRKTERAIQYILDRARRQSGDALPNSMERMFYTWHVHDSLREMLGLVSDGTSPAKTLEDNFALSTSVNSNDRCIWSLLE